MVCIIFIQAEYVINNPLNLRIFITLTVNVHHNGVEIDIIVDNCAVKFYLHVTMRWIIIACLPLYSVILNELPSPLYTIFTKIIILLLLPY